MGVGVQGRDEYDGRIRGGEVAFGLGGLGERCLQIRGGVH